MILLERKILAFAFLFSLMLLYCNIPATHAVTITVDGDTTDWAGISPIVTDAEDDPTDTIDIVRCYVTDDASYLYFRMDLVAGPDETGQGYFVFIDIDQSASTGGSIGGDIGVDYYIQCYEIGPMTAALYRWNGTTYEFAGSDPYAVNHELHLLEWRMSLAAMGMPILAAQSIDLVFRAGFATDFAPDSGHVTYPSELPESVGGEIISVNSLTLLAPWIAIAIAALTISTIVLSKGKLFLH